MRKALQGVRSGPLLPLALEGEACTILDLSSSNEALLGMDGADTEAFNNFIFATIEERGAEVGIGGYLEERHLYWQSPLFNNGNEEPRSIHLGLDLWTRAGTPVLAPLAGRVHSFADNDKMLDYGATIILEHEHEGRKFWTLYGHLSKESLEGLERGRQIDRGEAFARIGKHEENGGWAPHLHFQLILDIGSYEGDFPGVCKPSEIDEWRERCPDPNLLLRLERTKR